MHCQEVDQPVAGLLKDLKSRGLLEETLVVWASEMGRTPFDNNLTTDKPGRDHNQYGLVVWMAGGDVKPGVDLRRDGRFLGPRRRRRDPAPRRARHAAAPDGPGPEPPHLPARRPVQEADRHRRPGDPGNPGLNPSGWFRSGSWRARH